MALQRLEAGPVQVLGTLEIVFSFVWQVLNIIIYLFIYLFSTIIVLAI